MSVSVGLESADLGEHALFDGWDDSDDERESDEEKIKRIRNMRLKRSEDTVTPDVRPSGREKLPFRHMEPEITDNELLRRKRLESEASRESRNYHFNDVRQGDIFFFNANAKLEQVIVLGQIDGHYIIFFAHNQQAKQLPRFNIQNCQYVGSLGSPLTIGGLRKFVFEGSNKTGMNTREKQAFRRTVEFMTFEEKVMRFL